MTRMLPRGPHHQKQDNDTATSKTVKANPVFKKRKRSVT